MCVLRFFVFFLHPSRYDSVYLNMLSLCLSVTLCVCAVCVCLYLLRVYFVPHLSWAHKCCKPFGIYCRRTEAGVAQKLFTLGIHKIHIYIETGNNVDSDIIAAFFCSTSGYWAIYLLPVRGHKPVTFSCSLENVKRGVAKKCNFCCGSLGRKNDKKKNGIKY